MSELRSPDCKIYIDTELSDRELTGLIMQIISDAEDSTGVEIALYRSEDHDTKRRTQFPDGFLYFRYYLDVYVDTEQHTRVIGTLLRSLWELDIPAVAASPFEHLLPERGGYRSRAVPWPR